MKRDKTFYLWLVLLIVGVCCSCVLLGGRLWAESRDDRVAAAVYYDDVLQLTELSGKTEDDWLAMFSGSGVRYVIFETRPSEVVQGQLTRHDLSPAGYVEDGSAFGLPEHDWPVSGDIPLALVENRTRTSVAYPENFDLENYNGPLVKAFYVNDYYASRFSVDGRGQEVENLLFRAVVDRGMRLLLLRPFVDSDEAVVADPAAYANVLSGLRARLETRGLEYGESFSCMETTALKPLLLLGSGCLTAALWIFLVTRPERMRRWGFVLCLLALLGLCCGCLLLPKLMQKVLMLLCAAVFPCLAVYGLWCWRKRPATRQLPDWITYLLGLCALLLWSLLGGFSVSALMSDRSYLMSDLMFSGVKVSQMIPLLFTFVLFVIPVLKEFFDGPITKKKVLPFLAAGLLLVAAGAVLVLRSGDVKRISTLETVFRNTLEYAFYTRPRTKELLIGVPFAAFVFTAFGRKNSLVALLSGLCFCLESVSVVNTFCHAVAPIHVSLIRSALAAGLGCLLGLILIALYRVILRCVAKGR